MRFLAETVFEGMGFKGQTCSNDGYMDTLDVASTRPFTAQAALQARFKALNFEHFYLERGGQGCPKMTLKRVYCSYIYI